MRPVSAGWESTIRGSHKAVARARVCETFQTGVAPAGTLVEVASGSIKLDATADIRSTLDLTVPGVDDTGQLAWPTNRGALLLAPYGNELFIEAGVEYSDDLIEWVPLGYHRIQSPDQQAGPYGPIKLTALDRMAAIIDAKLLAPVQFVAGTTLGVVVNTLITDVYPAATIEWDDTTNLATLERDVVCEQDRYGFLADTVDSRGKIMYWDHRGVLAIKDLPDSTTPVYTVDHGRGGVLVSMSRNISRDGTYNAVVATGEGGDSTSPVRGVAVDNNPHSPTYYFGRYGKVPMFYSSPLLTDGDQANTAAGTLLRKQLGLPYNLKFGTITNAALEPYDTVRVRHPAGAENHVLQGLTIPLGPGGTMTADTREQSIILVSAP